MSVGFLGSVFHELHVPAVPMQIFRGEDEQGECHAAMVFSHANAKCISPLQTKAFSHQRLLSPEKLHHEFSCRDLPTLNKNLITKFREQQPRGVRVAQKILPPETPLARKLKAQSSREGTTFAEPAGIFGAPIPDSCATNWEFGALALPLNFDL
jgi:hypothetical protein